MADFDKTIKLLETAMNYNSVGLGRIVVHHDTLSDALELLKSQPQIVRCKDCKRYIEQAHECEALNQGCIKPDFFCGYGIRKDGDGDG